VAALAVNILANSLPLNGQNTGEISDRFDVYFVPAGYVFAIWGIIYIGWIAFSIYQALPGQRQNPRLRNLGYLFALAGLFNAAWLFCWHYNLFGSSVLVMLILLGLLIAGYLKLDVGRTRSVTAEKWCLDVPFSLYLGWITVATIANLTAWLYFIEWTGFGIAPASWAVLMLTAACLIGLGVARMRRDPVYPLVLAWSFVGIALEQSDTDLVAKSAWAAAVLSLCAAALSLAMQTSRPAGADRSFAD
jgi:hypothetical protein